MYALFGRLLGSLKTRVSIYNSRITLLLVLQGELKISFATRILTKWKKHPVYHRQTSWISTNAQPATSTTRLPNRSKRLLSRFLFPSARSRKPASAFSAKFTEVCIFYKSSPSRRFDNYRYSLACYVRRGYQRRVAGTLAKISHR